MTGIPLNDDDQMWLGRWSVGRQSGMDWLAGRPPADLRLRMLALARGESISHVLSTVLETALPTADELASQLRDQEAVPA